MIERGAGLQRLQTLIINKLNCSCRPRLCENPLPAGRQTL